MGCGRKPGRSESLAKKDRKSPAAKSPTCKKDKSSANVNGAKKFGSPLAKSKKSPTTNGKKSPMREPKKQLGKKAQKGDVGGPLVDISQIAEFLYYGGEFQKTFSKESGLDDLFEAGELDPKDVWVGYYCLDSNNRLISGKGKTMLTLHWQDLLEHETSGKILRDYFTHHKWSSQHLVDKPIARRGFEEIARRLKSVSGDDAVEVHESPFLWGDGLNNERFPVATEEEDDLRDPSQIKALQYWDGDTLLEKVGDLNKLILEKQVKATDIWVKYESAEATKRDYTVPWFCIVNDGLGHVLKSYFELTNWSSAHLKDKVMKKAYDNLKKCFQDEQLCKKLIGEYNRSRA